MKRIRYIEELNYFNAAACLLVILIHVLSLGIVSLNPATWQGFCIFMPWRISQFVVPAFLFSGAVKMSLTFPDRHEMSEMKNDLCRRRPSYKGYLLERCRTILLPYAVFILIYYFIYAAEGLVQPGWSTLLRGFATGDISGHFYYIIIIIQFYLLKPVWEKMLNYVPWQAGMAASPADSDRSICRIRRYSLRFRRIIRIRIGSLCCIFSFGPPESMPEDIMNRFRRFSEITGLSFLPAAAQSFSVH